MKNRLKKVVLIIGILIVIISIIVVLCFNNQKSVLFKSSHINYAWGYVNYGYIIYNDGVIQQYDDSKEKRIENLKKDKITKEELSQLKELSNKVEDKYEKNNNGWEMFDAGVSEKAIYSSRLSKFVILSRWGDSIGSNSTDTSKEILELTEKLYNKYLNNE